VSLPRQRGAIASVLHARYGDSLQHDDGYRRLHAACADAAVNRRVELIVLPTKTENPGEVFMQFRDYVVAFDGRIVATPRLAVRVYLDQPYSASSQAGLHCAPDPRPVAVPAPSQNPGA
jgi:hypothetical protein